MSEVRLKPCPFCGGEARLLSNIDGTSYVSCESCDAIAKTIKVSPKYSSDEKAIEAWNRRAENECMPAVDVRPERHGRIVTKSRVIGGVKTYKCPQCYHKWQENDRARVNETLCSECGAVLADSFQNFCPRCGAKMDEEEEW